MTMIFKLALAFIMSLTAIWVFVRGVETDFQPLKQTQIILFCTGFMGMFAIAWLLFPGSLGENLWLNLFMSIAFRLFWAFTAPKRWRFLQKKQKKEIS